MPDPEVMVLDHVLSDRAKADAMARVEKAARQEWVKDAQNRLALLATRQAELTPDDLWRTGLAKPREPRILGVVFGWAARAGYIEDTHRTVNTAQVKSHSAPVRVWRSLIYQG